MHKYLLILLWTAFIFTGCSKKEDANALKYTINGLTDLRIDNPGKLAVPLEVKYESGTQERVSLSVAGLPPSVTASFSAPSGIPGFASVMNLECRETSAGTHNIQVTGTTASGKTQSYDIKLTIPAHCREALLGSYTGKNCEQQPVTINISASPDSLHQVIIKGLPDYENESIVANVDCALKLMKTDRHVARGNVITTSGEFKAGTSYFELKYNVHGAGIYSCTLGLTKQK